MLYYTLLTKTIVDKAALVPAWEVPVALTWFIPREIKRGYIKEDELLVLGNHRAGKSYQQMKNLKFLSLTRKGYRHALDELKDVVPWVELMPEDFSGVQVPKIRNELIARYAKCVSAAAIMADLVGARECVPFVNSQNRKHRELVAPVPADEPDPPTKVQEDFLVGDEMWSFEFEDDLAGPVGEDDVEFKEHDSREELQDLFLHDKNRSCLTD